MRGVKTIIASQEVSKAGLSPAKNQPLLLFNFFEFIVFLRDSKQIRIQKSRLAEIS
jgi:hypothetical protein